MKPFPLKLARFVGYPLSFLAGLILFWFALRFGQLNFLYEVIQVVIAFVVGEVVMEGLLPEVDGMPSPRFAPARLKQSTVLQFVWFALSVLLGGIYGTTAILVLASDQGKSFAIVFIILAYFSFPFLWGRFDFKYLYKRGKKPPIPPRVGS